MSSHHPVTTDPYDPRFPHGSTTGYYRKCRCDGCSRSYSAHRKTHAVRVKLVSAEAVRSHLEDLLAVTGARRNAVSLAADVNLATVNDLLGCRSERVNQEAAEKLLALTADDLPTGSEWMSAEEAGHLQRTMQALGWTLPWQAQQIALRGQGTHNYPGDHQLKPDRANALRALARDVGTRVATVEDGFTLQAIARAKADARRAGFGPPQSYDEHGQHHPRWDPEHPWSVADASAQVLLRVVRALVHPARLRFALDGRYEDNAHSSCSIAVRVGVTARTVDRTATALGLSALSLDRARFAWVTGILDSYDDSEMGPITAALTLGLRAVESPSVPRDHPELVAWLAPAAPAPVANFDARELVAA